MSNTSPDLTISTTSNIETGSFRETPLWFNLGENLEKLTELWKIQEVREAEREKSDFLLCFTNN